MLLLSPWIVWHFDHEPCPVDSVFVQIHKHVSHAQLVSVESAMFFVSLFQHYVLVFSDLKNSNLEQKFIVYMQIKRFYVLKAYYLQEYS